MNIKNALRTAAVLAASMSVTAQAELVQIKQCLPMPDSETSIKSITLCNAVKMNAELGLELNAQGCAVRQAIDFGDGSGGTAYEQATNHQYVDGGVALVHLRDCDIGDVGEFYSEL